MTAKTFIRLTIVLIALTTGAVLLSSSRAKHPAAPCGEDGIQCREKNDDTKAQGDKIEIWESISRHLLGTNQ